MSYTSKLGITGLGIDVAKVYLQSNNLGDRERTMTTAFLEHRFNIFNDKVDITPGVAATYFSDFKFQAFPGVDMGMKLTDHLKLYTNAGYTYRIPTYTDLFYSDPSTLGNVNLNPEKAISEELGMHYSKGAISISSAVFNRDSNNLIDYVKNNEEDRWQATNIQDLNTFGVEINASYAYNYKAFPQQFLIGYTHLKENINGSQFAFSRYSINSLKHHLTATYRSQFFNKLTQTLVYKYADRTLGASYTVVDLMLTLDLTSYKISVIGNNIFNAAYTETNLVPMPGANILVDLSFRF